MIDYNQWQKNIYSAINDISDIPFQEEAWLTASTRYASSFYEIIATLYDSFGFRDEFWKEKYFINFKLSEELIKALKKLKDMIDIYFKEALAKKLSDEEVIKDPEWLKIVEQAKTVIELWK